MRFVLGWLSLGFVLKWFRENEKWRKELFDIALILLSFSLIIILLGFLNISGWMVLLAFIFWGAIVLVVKTN